MSEVPSEPLSRVAEVIMGSSPKGSSYNAEGIGAPLLNGPTDFGPRHPTATLFTTSGARFSEAGDILFCVRGSTTGRMNWSDRRYAIGRGIAAIRGRTRHETTYLRACIELVLPTLLSGAAGSTFPNLARDQMASIPVPMIPERESTGAFLAAIDDLIENNRRRIELLEQMAQAIYREWFVHFRYPGHEDAALVDSPLGPIPEGWEVKPFGVLAALDRTTVQPRRVPDQAFDHYSIPAFDDGQLPVRDKGEAIKSGKFSLIGPAVMVSKLNPRIERTWFVEPMVDRHSVASTEFLVLRPKTDFSLEFLYLLARSSDFQERLRELSGGTSTSHQRAKPDDFLQIQVVSPAAELAERLSEIVASPLRMTRVLRVENRALAAIRDLLLPKLVTGQIDVSELDLGALTESVA